MPAELRESLREAAAVPSEPLDLDRLLARGRRRRRGRQIGTVAAAFVLLAGVVVASVLAVPTRAPEPPPVTSPIEWAELPAGWSELPAPPEVRQQAATAWTGDQLIMWSGVGPGYSGTLRGNGFILDADTGGWREIAPSPLAARVNPASAWTGHELLVWGGTTPSGTRRFDDGAAYQPATDSWRPLPAAPIDARAPLSVWTGRELVVWGTAERRSDVPRDGAAYDPATGGWRAIAEAPIELTDATAVWTGREMIVLGATLDSMNRADTETAIGAAYDPASDTWRWLPEVGLSPQASTAAWNGEELIAWDYLLQAAAYDPAGDRWRSLPDVPLDTAECYPDSAPVGDQVFGEYCGAMALFGTADGRWRDVARPESAGWGRDPAARGWWFELLVADPVVVLLGQASADGQVVLAYRP
jgi:hypothetical protein